MTHHEHDTEQDVDPTVGADEPGDADPGFIGGGGPAETIEGTDPADEEAHRADGDHSIT
jgi:hypothetical protein